MSTRTVTAGGKKYELRAEAVRSSLSDSPQTLWGFRVDVITDGTLVAVKTCFVGRVSVQARHPEALQGSAEDLTVAIHALGLDKVVAGLEKGDDVEDGIIFA